MFCKKIILIIKIILFIYNYNLEFKIQYMACVKRYGNFLYLFLTFPPSAKH
jgi:hypothetical protein